MITIGIDIGKFNHCACVFDNHTGTLLVEPFFFENNKVGFNQCYQAIFPYKNALIVLEDTGHYGDNLVFFLLKQDCRGALINPITTEYKRKSKLRSTKNDKKDSILIAQVLLNKDEYRNIDLKTYHLRDLRQLTRHHHDLKEDLNVYKNRLQKEIDVVFPEFNSLFSSKYGIVYMRLLKQFGSAHIMANTNIRTLRNTFVVASQGKRIHLTPEQPKACSQ